MLTEVLAQLEDAKGEGSREHVGTAHLAVVSALGEMVEQAEGPEQRQGLYSMMLEHVGEALKVHQGLDPPWGLAQAHLVNAAILADIAQDEESEEVRLEYVSKSLDHCHQALTIMGESDQFHYQILSDAHAMAVATLLRLRSLVENDPLQQALDGVIGAYSENLGASLAWDIRHQGEGNDLLFLARVLNTLADGLEDSDERLEAVKTAFEAALEAAEMLWHTGNPYLARAAGDLAEEAKGKIEALEATIALQTQRLTCSICGHDNTPEKKFCIQCGAPLSALRSAEQESVIPAGDATLITSGWQLTIANGPNAGQSFPLGDRVRLGREAGNEIRLADRRVSRHHAILKRVGPGYLITDQGSSNGTYVNGVRISQPTPLHSGDTITIGDTQFTVLGEAELPLTGTKETIVCPICGAQIASRKFCTQCGAPLG